MSTPAANKPQKKKTWPAFVLVLLAIAVLIVVIVEVDHSPSTDDAYADADTIQVAPEVSGRIVELAVRDNQHVKQGDLLFRLDPRPFEASLARSKASLIALDKQIELTQRTVNAQQYNAQSARAAVGAARASAAQASDTLRRTEPLLSPGYVSAEDVDRARTAQASTQAQLSAAQLQAQQAAAAVSSVDALIAQRAVIQSEIALAELNLEYATVRAPFDGIVVSLKTSEGQLASALKPVFTLIDTRHWYVVANLRETQLKNIHPGTSATVYLMSNTDQHFNGVVQSVGYGVAPGEGAISPLDGLPSIQRTLNWVHVAQRFPVRILVDKPNPDLFRIGTSAVAVLGSGGGKDSSNGSH